MIKKIAIKYIPNTMSSSEDSPVWHICEEITSKRNWYTKVFNNEIVNHWKSELGGIDEFDLAIKLLRASAQGSVHLEDCNWEETSYKCFLCPDCLSNLKKDIIADPKKYSLDEIDDNFFDERWEENFLDDVECPHPFCQCTAPDRSLHNYVNYHPNGVLSQELHDKCKAAIQEMALQEPIDWHPGSNEQVSDIIHPSMYCYVKGVSTHNDGTVGLECNESVRFQWLPSEFEIGSEGNVTVKSYINNLKSEKYPNFIPLIERVFERFLYSLESVLKMDLKTRTLQVIVKVGSIILTPENNTYPGGSWHIEGMPYEHIAATCIHYTDVENITDSFLEFRKPTIINEENVDYPQSDPKYTDHHYGVENHYNGIMNRYLGLIRSHERGSIVFPNSLQHRVKGFTLADPTKPAVRTILAFFVIDPNHRIVSTADVPPQQNIFTLEQANFHRERLMFHRKYFVNQLNETVFERPFSLCEH